MRCVEHVAALVESDTDVKQEYKVYLTSEASKRQSEKI